MFLRDGRYSVNATRRRGSPVGELSEALNFLGTKTFMLHGENKKRYMCAYHAHRSKDMIACA